MVRAKTVFLLGPWVTPPPFQRIPYQEAMTAYGSDKPDLRNPITAVDVTEIFRGSEFAVFALHDCHSA